MPTYHCVQNQGKLTMQSWENGQKPQFGQFFDDFEAEYIEIANFSENRFHLNWRSYLVLTSGIVGAAFEKNIKMSDFGLIRRLFREYLQIKSFFQKSGYVNFLPLQSPNLMRNIRKILRAISEKIALPTNQPTNQLLPTTPIL